MGESIGKGLGRGGFEHGEVEERKRALEGGFGLRGGFAEAGQAARCEGSDALEVLESGLREMGEVPRWADVSIEKRYCDGRWGDREDQDVPVHAC